MRLVTYRSERGDRAGILQGDHVVDAGGSVRELVGDEERLASLSELGRERIDLSAVELQPPIPDPEKIVCIGLNYRSHAAEAGMEPPAQPTFFAKFRNALAPPGSAVSLPAASEKVDFEAEVAFVIGRPAKEVEPELALDHVAGYALLNDLSARDLQFATPQWMPGKVFDGSAPFGPALVTPDEAGPHDAIQIALDLNGERMQEASTADLIFSVPELVSRLSRWMTLEPGDIVSTGTPSGVGSTRDPRVWLRAGDRIEISSPTLGRLETTVE
jgi:2-keto-4-pentenoate hydratase/2-oxohepta-3-ene-1,7-dioic acid hydratase in catechol pathway